MKGVKEARDARAPRNKFGPIAEERRVHDRTHAPYRSWCPVCVGAAARDRPRSRQDGLSGHGAEFHVDYAFFRDYEGAPAVLVLCGRDVDSKGLMGQLKWIGQESNWPEM